MAQFDAPGVLHSEDSWGPGPLPDEYLTRPYQNYSKMERLGKIADWAAVNVTGPMGGGQTAGGGAGGQYAEKRNQGRQGGQDRSGGAADRRDGAAGPGSGTMAGIQLRDEDDTGYTLVDTNKGVQKPAFFRGGRGGRFMGQQGRGRGRGGFQPNAQYRQYAPNRRRGVGGFYPGHQGGRWDRRAPMKHRAASVTVKADWAVLEDLDFPRLAKLSFAGVSDAVDLYEAGYVEYYDRAYDRVNSMYPQKLVRTDRVFLPLPITTEDPIIRKLAKENPTDNVFATDSVIAALMCALRSVHSWDIVVSRFGNRLFLERREDSDLDTLLTVNETAFDAPVDDGNEANINSPRNLSLEAIYINQQFSQQVMDKQKKLEFKNPNPFIKAGDDASTYAPAAYKYRRFQLGPGINLVVRCEINAATHPVSLAGESEPTGPQLTQIYALNEVDNGHQGHIDWKSKIDTQRGSILATEIHNNSFKIAKWGVRAMLSGANYVKFGYVTRKDPNSNGQHTILGVQQFRPTDLLAQINLNVDNCWGVLRGIIDFCFKQKPGKYLIMKDPNKPVIRIYDCPTDAFEKEDDDSDDDETDSDEIEEVEAPKPAVDQEVVAGVRVLDPDEELGG